MANVLVIGGGAAGLLAGIAAAQSGAQTVILEKMRRPGKKIKHTRQRPLFKQCAAPFYQSGYCAASGG